MLPSFSFYPGNLLKILEISFKIKSNAAFELEDKIYLNVHLSTSIEILTLYTYTIHIKITLSVKKDFNSDKILI